MKTKVRRDKLYKIWNQVPVNYYQNGIRQNLFQKIWHTHKINLAKQLLANIKFKNCLDVGCASGYMVSEVVKIYPNAQYFGIDVYDKAIVYAKKKYPHIKFSIASASKLPFRGNTLDLVLCYETIEHVEDPKTCLLEMKRILRTNGTLILSMDSGSLLFRIVWYIWENTKGRVWDGAHIHPFHHKQLENLIINTGFRIKKKLRSFLGMSVTFVLSKNR